MIKQATFTDDSKSAVELQLHGNDGHFRVSLSSKSCDDMNVTYRFNTRPLADECYRTECERLRKIGFTMVSEVEYAKTKPTKESK